MLPLLRRSLLAAALGLGVTAGLVRAGDPVGVQAPVAASNLPDAGAPEGVTEEGVPCGEAGDGNPSNWSKLDPRRWKAAIRARLPLGCYGHHNHYSCSNLRAELVFLFGSCRQFYGEKCLKEPPVSPVPGFDPRTLTYTPGATAGTAGSGGAAPCRCR